MNGHFSNELENQMKNHSTTRAISATFIGLVILISYISPLISLASGPSNQNYIRLLYLYQAGSYSLIVIGFILLHAKGVNLISDHLSGWLIVVSCFLRARAGASSLWFYEIYIALLGFVLALFLLKERKNMRLPRAKSFITGIAWSIVTIIIIALIYNIADPNYAQPLPDKAHFLPSYLGGLLYAFSFVAVIEETLFRGLLPGFLILGGASERTAFIVQALLFWGIHYSDIASKPLAFFITVPLFTLSATLLMRKYRFVYLPILMHIFTNVLLTTLITLI